MADPAESRTRGRTMVAGVVWNGLGRGLPLLLALVLTPVLIHQLGLDRWGLFTLALAMVGVFGVFDFGVGQALTRAISERIGTGRGGDAAALVEAALGTLLGISLVVAIGLWFFVPVLVDRLLQVPPELRGQAIGAMRVLAAAAPLVVLNAALWGVLAAYQRFRAANLVTIPVNLFYYLGPVLVLLVWDSLIGVMLALVACRLANTLSYLWLIRPLVPGLGLRWPRIALVAPLLRLGGWMTFSGLLTQALLYADRFLIGALLSLSAVAFYATPLDLVLRVWILPVAVAQTLLPAFASSFASAPAPTAALLRRGGLLVMLLVFPACLVLVGGAREILWLWLGEGFAAGSARVLQWLGCGIFFSCVAFAPNALLDAIGRPDATAKFAALQAVIFIPLAALLIHLIGIEGAAMAWTARAATDCAGKFVLVARLYPPGAEAARRLALPMLCGGLGLLLLLPMPGLVPLLIAATLALGVFAIAGLQSLDIEERGRIGALIRQPRLLLKPGAL
ncbi:flippase [Belnapia rosea]|uniref:Membrane protein involved in the export of O-antigen and teichoic acid n=1 Tax=Belnapia rosea TaxID=938405 RepID=A0A1G6M7Y6_9PROT|nr:flippase [Belnapia rosea]SDB43974.1 Membrane protein involved in the export of O-antigen and teichoic acid [Belnapia rosea]SDC51570.1 Membrane protein involved in the export of O-antigen and teichoic acid [Belnapia rosea]